jgi:prepilin-type N-terminal cleavage/methylation domain-containing protein
MTFRTGSFRNEGFSVLEMLIVLVVFSLLLISVFSMLLRHRQGAHLEAASRLVLAQMALAQSSAYNEHRKVEVVFGERTFSMRREGVLVGREHPLPEHIIVTEKTGGFSPAVFLPDGTSEQAGHLILREEHSGKQRKLILYNVTGKCMAEE